MLIHDYDYDGLVRFLEDRLSSYITPEDIKVPPPGVPRATFDYFPAVFGGRFPALCVSELPSDEGLPSIRDERTISMPGVILMGLRIYHPSLTPPTGPNDPLRDGRAAAKRITQKIHSEWRKLFFADSELINAGAGGNVRITRREMGDHDRLNNPFTEETSAAGTGRILWVNSAEIRFEF